MPDRFIVVTGYSSCGTTFILALLKELGYDCGKGTNTWIERGNEWEPLRGVIFHNTNILDGEMLNIYSHQREDVIKHLTKEIPKINLPEVVKHPIFSRYLDEWIEAGGKKPNHIVFCVRDPNALGRKDKNEIREALLSWGKLIYDIHKHSIPFSMVSFPKSSDPAYLYSMLLFVNKEISPEEFLTAHTKIFKPERVRDG